MTCTCSIIPDDVLKRFAADKDLSTELRQSFHRSLVVSDAMRKVRDQNTALTQTLLTLPIPQGPIRLPKLHPLPTSQVYDCHHGTTLPGSPVATPGSSPDAATKRAYSQAKAVARFYWDEFQRDSIDDHHMTLVSTVHYSTAYNNAFWNGAQMTYGDGDGKVFVDFTLSNDVIGHELTHGVTQHSLGLHYNGEAGGLNESMSDVFGSMFRQWQAGQTAAQADWLIGADIIGPDGKAKGYICLRDMADPKNAHALAPQPDHYYPGIGTLDPHYSSGVPNLAFARAAKAIGGHSWEKAGQVWYKALTTTPPTPDMTMAQFAARTRSLASSLYADDASIYDAVNAAWTAVGV